MLKHSFQGSRRIRNDVVIVINSGAVDVWATEPDGQHGIVETFTGPLAGKRASQYVWSHFHI